MMRLADADLLAYDYTPQWAAIDKFVSELETLLKDKQAEIVPPFMNFAPLRNALAVFRNSATRYSLALTNLQASGSPPLPEQSLRALNTGLMQVSRMFLNQQGLPGRSWYKNQIYAPGAYTGYDAKPIAAVREYRDEKKWQEADAQIPQVARIIETAAAGISSAAEELEHAQHWLHWPARHMVLSTWMRCTESALC